MSGETANGRYIRWKLISQVRPYGEDARHIKARGEMGTSYAILGDMTVPDDHETAPGQDWRAQTCTTNRLETGERAGIATGVTRFT